MQAKRANVNIFRHRRQKKAYLFISIEKDTDFGKAER